MNLRPYQEDGVEWLRTGRRRLLADEPGMGKTPQATVAALRRRLSHNGKEHCPIIIITPLSGKVVWQTSFDLWARQEGVEMDIYTIFPNVHDVKRARGVYLEGSEGGVTNRLLMAAELRAIDTPGWERGVYILSYSQLNSAHLTPFINRTTPATLIVDECHKIKADTTDAHKRVKSIAVKSSAVWGLSGTPFTKLPSEMCTVMLGLDILETAKDFRDHRNEFFYKKERKYHWQTEWLCKDLQKYGAHCNAQGWVLRRRKKDHLAELPEKVVLDVWTKTDQKQALDEVKKRFANDAKQEKFAGKGVLSECERAIVGRQKAERLHEVLDKAISYFAPEKPGQFLLWCHHKEVAEMLRKKVDELTRGLPTEILNGDMPPAERDEVIARFQAGEVRCLICGIRAVGEAVTLTAARWAAFIQTDWTPAANHQAQDRIHRMTQERDCLIIRLFSEDSPVDVRVARVVDDRDKSMGAVMSGIRRERDEELALFVGAGNAAAHNQAHDLPNPTRRTP